MNGTLTDDDPGRVQFWAALSKGDVNKHSSKKPCYRRKQKGTGDVDLHFNLGQVPQFSSNRRLFQSK